MKFHARARRPLPRTVIVVAFVSLLNDFASEMVVPLIPLLLATVLAAGPIAPVSAGARSFSPDGCSMPLRCSRSHS
jgi:hypothetical protein